MIEQGWKWDEVTSDYWGEPSEDVYYYLSRWKELKLKRFLDLGCGIGRHSLFFASEGFDVTGFDLSQSGLEILEGVAKAKGLAVETVQGNVKGLPFLDDSFDCVLAYHSVYHTDYSGMMSAIDEINRVLIPDGEFFISLISKSHPDFSNDAYELIDSNSKMKPEEDGSVLPHFFVEYSEVDELFKGFEIVRVRHTEDFFENQSSWHYFIHGKKV